MVKKRDFMHFRSSFQFIFFHFRFEDFRRYALEDAINNQRYGIESLFRFYTYGCEKRFRKAVFNAFQEDTLSDYNRNHLYGLEKFWAFLEYSKFNKANIRPELQK